MKRFYRWKDIIMYFHYNNFVVDLLRIKTVNSRLLSLFSLALHYYNVYLPFKNVPSFTHSSTISFQEQWKFSVDSGMRIMYMVCTKWYMSAHNPLRFLILLRTWKEDIEYSSIIFKYIYIYVCVCVCMCVCVYVCVCVCVCVWSWIAAPR